MVAGDADEVALQIPAVPHQMPSQSLNLVAQWEPAGWLQLPLSASLLYNYLLRQTLSILISGSGIEISSTVCYSSCAVYAISLPALHFAGHGRTQR